MELQGKVHQILETETKGEKNFKTKRGTGGYGSTGK